MLTFHDEPNKREVSLNHRYDLLNRSFKKRLVYNLGSEAGFYSEYNNMILAMLYCLENKISFSLYSSNAYFKISKGWEDYFMPFCEEDYNIKHSRYNSRRPNKRQLGKGLPGTINLLKNRLQPSREKLIKLFFFQNGLNYFTHNLWNAFHSNQFEHQHFEIPELGISGSIQQACARLIDISHRFNLSTQTKVDELIATLKLPEHFIGLHIRRGDKIREIDYKDIRDYIEKAESISPVREAFVLTDDYSIISDLNLSYPNWKIYTLCGKNETGYDHKSFQAQTNEYKYEKQINLFASMEVLARSDYFIGTFSSNPGMFLGMRMPKQRCIGIDFDRWRIV